MPIFRTTEGKAAQLAPEPFASERELQRYVEANLEPLLGVRFVATEFATGEKHGGRIDTLGLDEGGNPVIVEYKWDRSESVINQGLFYLDWLLDHRGDFAMAVQKTLGPNLEIGWTSPRLVIVASTYTKYDTYAINQFPGNVELMRYQRYAGGIFLLESVNEPVSVKPAAKGTAAPSRPPEGAEYDLAYHTSRTTKEADDAFMALREKILALDGVTERVNQKSQITYRTTKSFAAVSFIKTMAQVQFKGGEKINDPENRAKDIRSRQWGYPWLCDLKSAYDVAGVYDLVRAAYEFEK